MEQAFLLLVSACAGLSALAIYNMSCLLPNIAGRIEKANIPEIILRSFLPNAGDFALEWKVVKPADYALMARFLMWVRIFQLSGLVLLIAALLFLRP